MSDGDEFTWLSADMNPTDPGSQGWAGTEEERKEAFAAEAELRKQGLATGRNDLLDKYTEYLRKHPPETTE